MARSLFQRPRGWLTPAFEDPWPPRWRAIDHDDASPKRRLPALVKLIGYLFAATIGVMIAFAGWLVAGGLGGL